MKIRKNDMVKVISGAHKGTVAKVVAVHPATAMVSLEGIGEITRHVKPNRFNPRGTTRNIHRPISISNVALVADGTKTTRVGYLIKKDGTKVRVARSLGNKELK